MFLCQENKDPWLPEGTCPCVLLVSFAALHLCLPQTTLAHASCSALGLTLSLNVSLRLFPSPSLSLPLSPSLSFHTNSHKMISNPPRHPSLFLTAHLSSCVSAHCEEAHYETFQCWASPVGPFLFDTCAANESFTSLISSPPFISKGWISAEQWKSRRWINHSYKLSHMAAYCTGMTGNEKALLRKLTRPKKHKEKNMNVLLEQTKICWSCWSQQIRL